MSLSRRGFLGALIAAPLLLRKRSKPAPARDLDIPDQSWSAVGTGDLQKALSVGYQSDRARVLRVESLEATLRVVTFKREHVKAWRVVKMERIA